MKPNTFKNLNYVLAGLYDDKDESKRIVEAAGIPKMFVSFKDKPVNNWYSILSQAKSRNKIEDLVDVVLGEYPDNPHLNVFKQTGELNDLNGPEMEKDIPWKGDSDEGQLEKLMNDISTLLPINFLEKGLDRSRSVAKILVGDECGSGFLIDNNILLTNNHVLKNDMAAGMALVQFNYQKNASGMDASKAEYTLNPSDLFVTSVENDWTAVRVAEDVNSKWGAIPIRPIEAKKNERVSIIQHPAGDQKQIAIHNNLVQYADATRVQYLTDTMPGSSGSPVFNSNWDLVAIHHSGGWLREPKSKRKVFRNEGIAINCVIEALKANGVPV